MLPTFLLLSLTAAHAEPTGATPLMETMDGAGTIYGGTHFRSEEAVNAMVFGADSSTLWTTLGTQVRQWSIATGEQLSTFDLPCGDEASSIAPSPDGSHLAIGCDSDSLMIVNTQGNVQTVIKAEGVDQLEWNGKVIAGHLDDHVVFWSAKSGKELNRLSTDYFSSWSGHGGAWIVAGALDAGGADSSDQSERMFLVGLNAKAKIKWQVPMESNSGFAWSNDGSEIAVAMNGNLSLRKASDGEEILYQETDYGINQILAVKGGYWVVEGEAVHRVDAKLVEAEELLLEAYTLVSSPNGAWIMDPTGARPRLFSDTGIPHLADEGLAERADGVLGAGDILAAFTASEAVVINRSTGLHHSIPFAPDAAAISLQGDYVAFGGTGILLVDANGTSEVIRGTETHDGFDLLTFSEDGRWLWALSSSYGEASLSQIDVEKRQLLNRRKISDQLGSYSSVLADHSALLFPLDDGRVQVIPLVPKE